MLGGLGALLGMAGAVAYAWLMMLGLRTLWVGAVGTRALTLAVGPLELALGAAGGMAAARSRGRGHAARAARALGAEPARPRPAGVGAAARVAAHGLGDRARDRRRAAALRGRLRAARRHARVLRRGSAAPRQRALLFVSARLSGERQRAAAGATATVAALGFRQAAFRPGRSVLAVALVAFASFVIASVGAFRHTGPPATGRTSETGGFSLLARSVLPLHHDPGTPEGRAALGLDGVPELAGARLTRFRLKPGEDASCLNLYRPERPTLIAPAAELPGRGTLRVPEEPGRDQRGEGQPLAAARARRARTGRSP